MGDGWWVMGDGWWVMGDEWWVMSDEWWVMSDEWQLSPKQLMHARFLLFETYHELSKFFSACYCSTGNNETYVKPNVHHGRLNCDLQFVSVNMVLIIPYDETISVPNGDKQGSKQ